MPLMPDASPQSGALPSHPIAFIMYREPDSIFSMMLDLTARIVVRTGQDPS